MSEWVKEYWLETIFGLIVAGATCFTKKKFKEQEAMKMGMVALLRDRIVQSYNYYMDLGYCQIYSKENIESLYLQYHLLGGNGTVTNLYDKIMALPTKKVGDTCEEENRI